MFRLFTAIDLSAQYKHELVSRMGGLPHVRWQTEDQIHLTLRFIGGVEERLAEEIRLLLASIDYKPFPLKVSGVGTFGNRRKARMIWAGVNKSGSLKALQEKITNVLRRAGVPPEERKYTPHITLARVKGDNGPKLQEFLKNNRDLSLPEFEVLEFRLMQSHLGGTGAHYRVVETYPAKSVTEAG
jgi:2'-5' RNA ligase